jgi:hypothetical protein
MVLDNQWHIAGRRSGLVLSESGMSGLLSGTTGTDVGLSVL